MRTVGIFLKNEAPPKKDGALNFEKMTVSELKAFAAENSIELGTAALKADIIAIISEVME